MTGTVHVCWWPHSKDTSRTDWLDTTEMGRFGRLKMREDRQRFLTSKPPGSTVSTMSRTEGFRRKLRLFSLPSARSAQIDTHGMLAEMLDDGPLGGVIAWWFRRDDNHLPTSLQARS